MQWLNSSAPLKWWAQEGDKWERRKEIGKMPKMPLGFLGLGETEGVCKEKQKLTEEYGRRRLLTWQ